MATTSTEGSRRANYPLLDRGGSDLPNPIAMGDGGGLRVNCTGYAFGALEDLGLRVGYGTTP